MSVNPFVRKRRSLTRTSGADLQRTKSLARLEKSWWGPTQRRLALGFTAPEHSVGFENKRIIENADTEPAHLTRQSPHEIGNVWQSKGVLQATVALMRSETHGHSFLTSSELQVQPILFVYGLFNDEKKMPTRRYLTHVNRSLDPETRRTEKVPRARPD